MSNPCHAPHPIQPGVQCVFGIDHEVNYHFGGANDSNGNVGYRWPVAHAERPQVFKGPLMNRPVVGEYPGSIADCMAEIKDMLSRYEAPCIRMAVALYLGPVNDEA